MSNRDKKFTKENDLLGEIYQQQEVFHRHLQQRDKWQSNVITLLVVCALFLAGIFATLVTSGLTK